MSCVALRLRDLHSCLTRDVQCLTHAMRQDPFDRAEPKITDANQDFHVLRENFILALKLHKLIRSLAVNVDKSDERACHVETAE